MNKSISKTLKTVPIEELHLSPESYRSLKGAGVNSVYAVCRAINNNWISKILNIGIIRIDEIVKQTEQFLSTYNPLPDEVADFTSSDINRPESVVTSDEIMLPDVIPSSDILFGVLNKSINPSIETITKVDNSTASEPTQSKAVVTSDEIETPEVNPISDFLLGILNKPISFSLKEIPIEEINLSTRPHNALRRAGVNSVFDVCQAINNNTILNIFNIGVNGIDEILKQLEKFLSTYNGLLEEVVDHPDSETNQSEHVVTSDENLSRAVDLSPDSLWSAPIKSFSPSLKTIPIEELNLSVRPHHAFKRAGVNTVFDVCQVIENNTFLKIKNIGDKSIKEIVKQTELFLSTCGASRNEMVDDILQEVNRRESDVTSVEIKLPNVTQISNVSLGILNTYLGQRTINNLLSIGINRIADLDKLLQSYVNFLTPGNLLLDKTIELQNLQIRKMICQGNLSPNCFIESTALIEVLDWKPANDSEKKTKIQVFERILGAESLTQEINKIMGHLTDRQREIFLDYSLHDLTLEEIANKPSEGVTRERIRQILNDAIKKLRQGLDKSLKVYISGSFEVAKELGTALSKEAWESQLIERKILLDGGLQQNSFELFCALIKNKSTSKSIFGIPENVLIILKNPKTYSIYVINALNNIPKEKFRQVNRIVKFTGGIQKSHAEQIIGCDPDETAEILKVNHMIEIIPDWFSIAGEVGLGKNTPLFRAGLIMMQACGPLEFESFCDGLRRYISRHFDTIAPPEVVSLLLKKVGFKIENNIVSYDGENLVELARSDVLILDLLKEKGPVLSFQEIVEFYLDAGLSFATPTTRVMPASPTIEKIEQGLYKLRGSKVTWQQLESAKSRQDDYSRNVEVTYGLDGIIRYRVNVGTWALGGVLSISRSGQPLPDFQEGWPIYVNREKLGIARRDDLLIWGLSPAFHKLGVKVGDRLELAFDTWNEPRIDIRVVEEENG